MQGQHYFRSVNNAPHSGGANSGCSGNFCGRAVFPRARILAFLLGLLGFSSDAVVLSNAAEAQILQEGGDFSFRRVAPPSANGGKRITVQIDPNAEVFRITPGGEPRRPGDPRPEAATQLPAPLSPTNPTQPTEYDWYWEAVSPVMGVDPASRFRDAIAAIERSTTRLPTPRLQTLRSITDKYGVDILTSTIGTDVSPALVLAVIAIESAGRPEAVSHAGAEGLMQLIPATAARFGVSDSKNPGENIRGGVTYLDWLLKEFNGDVVLALAGYNAGEGAVAKHSGVPPYAETRAYVPKVLSAWNIARALCLTPPDLVTDGCVFVASASQTQSTN